MAIIDLLGRLVDRIMNKDNLHTFNRATDSLEVLSEGMLTYVGLTTANGNVFGLTLVCGALAALPDYSGQLVKILSGGAIGQTRVIDTDVAGTLTVGAPFTDAAGAIQQILTGTAFCIISRLALSTSVLDKIDIIFDLANATLRLQETYDSLTADGTEQTIYQNNAPLGVFDPRKIKVDMNNMAVGDIVVLRWYERISSGGGLIQKDEMTFNGVQDPPLINIELEPNRYGFRVSLQQTAGTNRVFPWEYLYES